MSINKFDINFDEIKRFFSNNWKPNAKAIIMVAVFFFVYILLSNILDPIIAEPYIYLLPLILIIFTVIIYYYVSNKTYGDGLKISLLLALVFQLFSTISSFTAENIVYNYLSFPLLIFIEIFFISGVYLSLKNKSVKEAILGFILMFISLYIFDLLKDVIFGQLDFWRIFVENYFSYLVLSIKLGLPALVHYNWIRKRINLKKGKMVYAMVFIGVILTIFSLIKTVGGLLVFYSNEMLFQRFVFIEGSFNLYGFNYLFIFLVFGIFSYLILEKGN